MSDVGDADVGDEDQAPALPPHSSTGNTGANLLVKEYCFPFQGVAYTLQKTARARRPSRVPVDEDSVSVQRVWDRFVEAALNQEVDAVVLTGDLVGWSFPQARVPASPLDALEIAEADAPTIGVLHEYLAARSASGLAHVAYRLAVEGRTQLHREIEALTDGMQDTLQVAVDDTTATLEAVVLRTRPDYDLEAPARGNDPPGVLARMLLRLERGELCDDDAQALLRRASKAASVHASSRYEPL